jgi:hypothetical protein
MDCALLFQEAMERLIPVAEKARMAWGEPQAYDDWDRIAAALFQSLVIDAVQNAEECKGWPPIVAYDSRLSTYDGRHSYLFDATEGVSSPFVCLETSAAPFDTCLFLRLDAAGAAGTAIRKPLSAADLHAVAGFGCSQKTGILTVNL